MQNPFLRDGCASIDLLVSIRPGGDLEPCPSIFRSRTLPTTSSSDCGSGQSGITNSAADLQQAFAAFRERQIAGDGSVPTGDKINLRLRLKGLEDELNRNLSIEYGVLQNDAIAIEKWVRTHQPFHWFIEYYKIMSNGGFDVVIGNPPYIETGKIKEYNIHGYATERCGNIYATCVERSSELLRGAGYLGVIVPLSGFSTARMREYQNLLLQRFGGLALSFYSGDAHPSVLFDGVKYRLSIIIGSPTTFGVSTTAYIRWYAAERDTLFASKILYELCEFGDGFLRFAKLGDPTARKVIAKLNSHAGLAAYVQRSGPGHVTYHRSPVFWIRSMDFEPYFKSPVKNRSTDHLKDLYFSSKVVAKRAGAIINSTFFYFWFSVQGNCRNIAASDIESMPAGDLTGSVLGRLDGQFDLLMDDLKSNSRRRIYEYKTGTVEYDEFYPSHSKPFINEIDGTLSEHFRLNQIETDYIVNYDVKYRIGQGDGDGRDASEEDDE